MTPDVTTWKQFFEVAGTTLRGQDPDRRPPDQLVRLGRGGHGLLAQHHRPDRDGRGGGDAHGAQAQAVRDLVATSSRRCAPSTRWLSVAWTGDGVQVGRDNPDARVPRRHRRRRALDRLLHGRRRCPASRRRVRVPQLHPPARAGRGARRSSASSRTPTTRPRRSLAAEVKGNPVIYPPADSLAKLEYAVNATYNSAERAEAWARIKASA